MTARFLATLVASACLLTAQVHAQTGGGPIAPGGEGTVSPPAAAGGPISAGGEGPISPSAAGPIPVTKNLNVPMSNLNLPVSNLNLPLSNLNVPPSTAANPPGAPTTPTTPPATPGTPGAPTSATPGTGAAGTSGTGTDGSSDGDPTGGDPGASGTSSASSGTSGTSGTSGSSTPSGGTDNVSGTGQTMQVYSTAYNPSEAGGSVNAQGGDLAPGQVAVNPNVIPYGTQFTVSDPNLNAAAIAEGAPVDANGNAVFTATDTGSAVVAGTAANANGYAGTPVVDFYAPVSSYSSMAGATSAPVTINIVKPASGSG